MKSLLIILMCISMIIVFVHCAGTGKKGFATYGQLRVFNAEYDRVFQATLDYFRDLGYLIQTADWESGKIETDYKLRARGYDQERRSRMIARVLKMADNQTKLTLEYLNEVRELNKSWELLELQTTDEMQIYDTHFEHISERIQGKSKE